MGVATERQQQAAAQAMSKDFIYMLCYNNKSSECKVGMKVTSLSTLKVYVPLK